jgi:hypothetical protein
MSKEVQTLALGIQNPSPEGTYLGAIAADYGGRLASRVGQRVANSYLESTSPKEQRRIWGLKQALGSSAVILTLDMFFNPDGIANTVKDWLL